MLLLEVLSARDAIATNRSSWRFVAIMVLCLGNFWPAGAAQPAKAVKKYQSALQQSLAVQGRDHVADLHVVDCLLPGKVRRLANTTYLGPRRPVQTTAADCRIKGGEYTDYDRADYRTALAVWLPSAEAGDAQAQANVGQIFERGLGGEPNYAAALIWYRKAAEQGNTRAQFALGTLFEQGLGVEKNQLEAINWYRLAWGIDADNLIFTSAAQRQREEEAQRLQQQIHRQDAQLNLLREEIDALQVELREATDTQASIELKRQTLQDIVTDLIAKQTAQRTELVALESEIQFVASRQDNAETLQLREPSASPETPVITREGEQTRFNGVPLGRYYALLIGNAEYEQMEDLQTPLNDIARAGEILRDKYGFTVFTLDDGNNVEMMQAINNLASVLKEEDNLLIFFAGHGSRLARGEGELGYWLPSNAERPPRNTFWVSNEFLTGHLARLSAKRVLVVADSCYAGLLAGEPSLSLMGADNPQYANPEFLQFKLSKRARLLLSSGGDSPVLDQGRNGHSIFASAFLDALESNTDLLSSPQLFLQVRDRVRSAALARGFVQQPELKSIRAAGHEVGDFFFYPR
ncbi:MAG: caspase family protein [Pseudomonadaceae bacterium]|nr:caspase family protein [Pseudomonadaceae bacterium]